MTGRRRTTARRRDRGSGTVLALALVAAAGLLALGIAGVGRAVVVRHRAQAAADLAALAAATGWPSADCPRAVLTARANGVVLLGCTPSADGSVRIVVRSSVVVLPDPVGPVAVTADARAGPGGS
jgi:secretion/DNA translocation related TadE-like protein